MPRLREGEILLVFRKILSLSRVTRVFCELTDIEMCSSGVIHWCKIWCLMPCCPPKFTTVCDGDCLFQPWLIRTSNSHCDDGIFFSVDSWLYRVLILEKKKNAITGNFLSFLSFFVMAATYYFITEKNPGELKRKDSANSDLALEGKRKARLCIQWANLQVSLAFSVCFI